MSIKHAFAAVLLLCVTHAMWEFNTGSQILSFTDCAGPAALAATARHHARHQWMQFALALLSLAALVTLEVFA